MKMLKLQNETSEQPVVQASRLHKIAAFSHRRDACATIVQRSQNVRTSKASGSKRRALTLVEVLAVVVILGLIAAALMYRFSGSFGKAKQELARTGIAVIVNKLDMYYIEYGDWPPNSIGLAALTDGHAAPTASYYLSPDQLLDPWNNKYHYVTPGPGGHPFEVISYGADNQPGGTGESADISSTNLRGAQ